MHSLAHRQTAIDQFLIWERAPEGRCGTISRRRIAHNLASALSDRLEDSLDAFLNWERDQETAFEFDGIVPVAMAGGTLVHRLIADDLVR